MRANDVQELNGVMRQYFDFELRKYTQLMFRMVNAGETQLLRFRWSLRASSCPSCSVLDRVCMWLA